MSIKLGSNQIPAQSQGNISSWRGFLGYDLVYGQYDGKGFNTYVGAKGVSLPNSASLASKLSLSATDIQDYTIDSNNNISCNIYTPYSINSSAFSNDSEITYFLDLNGSCTSLGSNSFSNAGFSPKQKFLVFPNVTSNTSNGFNGGGAGTRNKLGIMCLPKLTPIGSSGTTSDDAFSWADFFYNVYVDSSNQTINAGAPDPDIASAISSNIGSFIQYSSNSNKPSSVTNLTVTVSGLTNVELDWNVVEHTNVIDYYVLFVNGNISQISNATSASLGSLTPGLLYTFKVLTIDEHGNNSNFSDDFELIIPNTYIGGVGTTSVTSPDDYVSKTSGLTTADITNFEIDVNNNVRFNVDKSYTVNGNVGSWDGDTNIKYLIDLDGNITNLGAVALRTTSVTSLYVPGLTTMASSETRYCPISYTYHPNVTSLTSFIIANTSGVNWIRLPSTTTLGISSLRNLSELDRCYVPSGSSFYYDVTEVNPWISATNSSIAKIYVDSSISGSIPAGLEQSEDTYGWNLVFITDYTAPSAVSNLSASSITSTGCTLNFTAPSTTNTLDFYEVWVENVDLDLWHEDRVQGRYNINQEITGSGDVISGLSTNTTYEIYIISCDIYWNRSPISNVITITTT